MALHIWETQTPLPPQKGARRGVRVLGDAALPQTFEVGQRTNMANTRQSQQDSGLGYRVTLFI